MADKIHGPWIATALASALSSAKLKLWTSGTANPDHEFMGDVDGAELSTTGYTSGFAGTAITLSGISVTYDSTNNRVKLVALGGTITSIGVPAGVAVTLARIYIPNTTYANSKIVTTLDCAITVNGSNLAVTLDVTLGLGAINL